MSFAGSMGVSRRSWDIEAAGSIYGPAAHLFLGLMGLGAIVAFVGLMLFILLTVGTLLFGRSNASRPMENWGTPRTLTTAPPEAALGQVEERHPTQGTLVLAIIFLLSFAVYYFANWKALADLWPVS
jgi:cytochrome c oxidase subunit I